MRYAALLLLIIGCGPRDLAPVAAVYGTYGIMESRAPVQRECAPECACNGTGLVRSGDGLAMVDCGCATTCRCKGNSHED